MKNKKNIVVTGGAGFIGSHIASRLISEGYKVTVLDNLSTGKEENIPNDADFIKMDLGRKNTYSRLKNIHCNAIFHLAGQSSGEASFKDPYYDFCSHVLSTFWLLDWSKKSGVKRFLYSSSMSIYGDPSYLPVDENHPLKPKTFYAAAKVCAEVYIKFYKTFGIDTTIFRLFSVYGPGQNLENKMQGIVSIYLSYMLEQVPIGVKGPKERFRDLIFIDDVVDVWLMSLDDPVTYGKVYNVAGGKKTKVEDLIKALRTSFGYLDYPIEYLDPTPGDQFGMVGDITLIKQELNWKPRINLKTGLKKMIDFEKGRLRNG